MSNIKRIEISGTIPFNADEFNPEIIKLYGQLNMPSFGLRLQWLGPVASVPNEKLDPNTPHKGGSTSMYRFDIHGDEAVRKEWVDWAVKVLKAGKATIHTRRVVDIENNEIIYDSAK